ncbi:MAG: hypothetical protein PHG23_00135 [Candidatus Pacebacteria bacterium]|nr:hypothetical protein [Candidatus Paceibacterota bacterium]
MALNREKFDGKRAVIWDYTAIVAVDKIRARIAAECISRHFKLRQEEVLLQCSAEDYVSPKELLAKLVPEAEICKRMKCTIDFYKQEINKVHEDPPIAKTAMEAIYRLDKQYPDISQMIVAPMEANLAIIWARRRGLQDTMKAVFGCNMEKVSDLKGGLIAARLIYVSGSPFRLPLPNGNELVPIGVASTPKRKNLFLARGVKDVIGQVNYSNISKILEKLDVIAQVKL